MGRLKPSELNAFIIIAIRAITRETPNVFSNGKTKETIADSPIGNTATITTVTSGYEQNEIPPVPGRCRRDLSGTEGDRNAGRLIASFVSREMASSRKTRATTTPLTRDVLCQRAVYPFAIVFPVSAKRIAFHTHVCVYARPRT